MRSVPRPLPQKIVVVGTSGSGKTTFARALAARLKIPHIELDSLHWEANWTPAPVQIFRERVSQATAAPAWIVEGNYGKVRDATWRNADTLIWLDYPFPIVFGRALLRTIRRSFTREVLWQGNRESLLTALFSKESILLWVIQTYSRRRREYPELLSQPEFSHLQAHRFLRPRDAEKFLASLNP